MEKDKRYPRQGLRSRKWTGWTELILFIIYFFFVRLFLHIIIYYDNCFNYYVLSTLFLLVNTFLLILHVFNTAFIVISSIFIKRLKNIIITVQWEIPLPGRMLSLFCEFEVRRESFLQLFKIQKKPLPGSQVKYLVPLNVPSQKADVFCSYKTKNIKNLFALFFKTNMGCRVVIEVRTLALSQCRLLNKKTA